MKMTHTFYLIAGISLAIIMLIVIIVLIKKKKIKSYKEELMDLERQRNLVISTPVMMELSKIETLLNNDKLKEKYEEWKERYQAIKNDRFPKITDMLLEADNLIESKSLKEAKDAMTKLEMEIYKIRVSVDNLLNEIREIAMSEERNRAIVTKLKSKYREVQRSFESKKESYREIAKYIELQFENIEKRFQDFEIIMENNDYTEVVNSVKAIDEVIAHISTVVLEVPDLVLLTNKILPERIKEVSEKYNDMVDKGYPLDYLNIDYNIDQINKKISSIQDRAKILNLEDSLFEAKTFLDYLDGVLNDLDVEKRSKKLFDELANEFKEKIVKMNDIVTDIYDQLEDIKNMYNLQLEDLKDLEDFNKSLFQVNNSYNGIITKLKNKEEPYSTLYEELHALSSKFESLEGTLNECLRNLGSMQEDEARAREQYDEIINLLKRCKMQIKSYKLPIISNNYFVELQEATDAVLEIEKELNKTPITIKTLNIRVDTARDLSFKLYNTTNEIIKTAKLCEMTIIYGNRYKPLDPDIEAGLNVASKLFFRGNYTKGLETAIASINVVEPDIYAKMLNLYKETKK